MNVPVLEQEGSNRGLSETAAPLVRPRLRAARWAGWAALLGEASASGRAVACYRSRSSPMLRSRNLWRSSRARFVCPRPCSQSPHRGDSLTNLMRALVRQAPAGVIPGLSLDLCAEIVGNVCGPATVAPCRCRLTWMWPSSGLSGCFTPSSPIRGHKPSAPAPRSFAGCALPIGSRGIPPAPRQTGIAASAPCGSPPGSPSPPV